MVLKGNDTITNYADGKRAEKELVLVDYWRDRVKEKQHLVTAAKKDLGLVANKTPSTKHHASLNKNKKSTKR